MTKQDVEKDAAGQFKKTQAGGHNDGVDSAQPEVITGKEDATAALKEGKKEWNPNFDPREDNEGNFRG